MNKLVWRLRNLYGETPAKRNRRFHLKRRSELFNKYFANHHQHKLQIGAQSNSIEGWLNVDIEPKTNDVAFMDATEIFPFKSETFDYVYAEHMIEHIQYEDADNMIRECFRVLKPGGKIRIATPNLDSLAQVVTKPDDADSKEYVNAIMERFYPQEIPQNPVYVINKLFYGFHHRFIHNEVSLQYLFTKHGFEHGVKCAVGESSDEYLCGIEQHGKEIGNRINAIETLVVQANKPDREAES